VENQITYQLSIYALADSRNIAPVGWHMPSDDEWKKIEIYLGLSESLVDTSGWRQTEAGGKLKESGYEHWEPYKNYATNTSGFTALPGGNCSKYGSFTGLGFTASFWSSTESSSGYAWSRGLEYGGSAIGRYHSSKLCGQSVRCVKD
jgi:uncharacterized protein (TIGR02145 family)